MKEIKKAVVLLAGYGTRFLPFTKSVPKPLLPIINKPTIQLILEELINSGITDVAFVVGYKKNIIKSYFSKSKELERACAQKKQLLEEIQKPEKLANITWITQKQLNGTGGALLLAKKFVKDEPFACLYADDLMYNEVPVTKQLINVFENTGKSCIGCKKVSHKDVPMYASVEYTNVENGVYSVVKLTEKPKLEDVKSDLSPLGRFVLTSEIFDALLKTPVRNNGEICLTDGFDVLANLNRLNAIEFEGERYDMGDKLGFLKANVEEGLRDPEISEEFKKYLKDIINA